MPAASRALPANGRVRCYLVFASRSNARAPLRLCVLPHVILLPAASSMRLPESWFLLSFGRVADRRAERQSAAGAGRVRLCRVLPLGAHGCVPK